MTKNYNKLLKILFMGVFIIGTIGVIFVGWKTYDTKNKAVIADVDTSLNNVNCGNGKNYKIGQYTGIHSKSDVNFLDDIEFRYLCNRGLDIAQGDKQKIIDFITGQDTGYFTKMSNISSIHGDVFGNWPLANPTNISISNPQLTDSQVEQAVIKLNHKDYDNILYSLVNIPKPKTIVTFDYKDTFLTLLLFLFIVFVLQKITYYIIEKMGASEQVTKLNKQYPLILPALFICVVIVIAVKLAANNANPEELLTLNQKCHDLATKYVDDQNTKYKTNPLTNETDYSAPFNHSLNLNSYAYSQNLNTCVVYYADLETVNSLSGISPVPTLPSGAKYTETSFYVDDVISGKTLAHIDLDTDCDMKTNYCPNLVNFNLRLKSWGLSDLSYWQTLFLQTVGRFSFVRSWMGL